MPPNKYGGPKYHRSNQALVAYTSGGANGPTDFTLFFTNADDADSTFGRNR